MMRDMWKRDVNDMLMSPLAVNTDDMLVMTMPPLEFRYFDVLPEKIKLQNNGLTGKVTITNLRNITHIEITIIFMVLIINKY